MARTTPFDDPTSFGNLAVELGYITEQQLGRVLRERKPSQQIGAAMVALGLITEHERDTIASHQMMHRKSKHRDRFEGNRLLRNVERFADGARLFFHSLTH